MADNILHSGQQLADEQSFYNVIRKTGLGATPFWDSLNDGIPFEGIPSKGHSWAYMPQPSAGEVNAHKEGSIRADITSYPDVILKNQLQIFKKTSGITESESYSLTVEKQRRKIGTQQVSNRKQMRLDVEFALISSDAPVVATDALADIRKMGGVLHYVPALAIFDIADAVLSIKNHVDEALKLMWINGMSGERIVLQAGVDAFSSLQFMYSDKKQLKNIEKTIHNIVTKIISAWFPLGITLEANPNFLPNEIRIYAPSLIKPVLLRSVKNNPCSDPEFDIDVTEDKMELSVQIEDPFAMVQIKNIGA